MTISVVLSGSGFFWPFLAWFGPLINSRGWHLIFFTFWPLYQYPLMQGPISLKRDDDDDNGMQGLISLKRDAASFSASVQHCTLRPLAGCTDLTGHRSFAIIIFQRQGKLPTADAFLIPASLSSSSQWQCERWYCPINDLGKGSRKKAVVLLDFVSPPTLDNIYNFFWTPTTSI